MTDTTNRPRRPSAAAALLLAAAWIATGAGYKWLAGSPADLPRVIFDSGLPVGLVYKLAIGIELLVVATALLRPRIGWALVALQYLAFLAVLLPALLSGAESCGCFGSKVKIAPGTMMAIDGVLLALVLATRPWSARLWATPPAVAALVAAAGLAAPWVHDRGASRGDGPPAFVLLEPEGWLGRSALEIDLAAHLETPADLLMPGTWVLYRDSCPHCADHMRLMMSQDLGGEPITLVKIPEPDLDPAAVQVHVKPSGPHVTEVSLVPGPDYVVEGPVDLRVEWEDYLVSRVRLAPELAQEDQPAFPAPDPAVLRAAAGR